MKRATMLAVAFVVIVGCVPAQQYPTDVTLQVGPSDWDVSVTWDAVDASGYLPTDVLSYEVMVRDAFVVLDDQIVANIVLVVSVSGPAATVDFTGYARGRYYVGVRTVVDDGLGSVAHSGVAWSYNQVDVAPYQTTVIVVAGVPPDPDAPDQIEVVQ